MLSLGLSIMNSQFWAGSRSQMSIWLKLNVTGFFTRHGPLHSLRAPYPKQDLQSNYKETHIQNINAHTKSIAKLWGFCQDTYSISDTPLWGPSPLLWWGTEMPLGSMLSQHLPIPHFRWKMLKVEDTTVWGEVKVAVIEQNRQEKQEQVCSAARGVQSDRARQCAQHSTGVRRNRQTSTGCEAFHSRANTGRNLQSHAFAATIKVL